MTEGGMKPASSSWSVPNMNGLKFLGWVKQKLYEKVDNFFCEHFDSLPKDKFIIPPPELIPILTPPISPMNYYPSFPGESAPDDATSSNTCHCCQHQSWESGTDDGTTRNGISVAVMMGDTVEYNLSDDSSMDSDASNSPYSNCLPVKRTYDELCHLRIGQCNMKRIRITVGSTESANLVQHNTLYKGITKQNGKWNAKIRVSMTVNMKVWLGTSASAKEVALAYNVGLHHCTAKKKKFNFPDLVPHLGPSHYNDMLALCNDGHKELKEEAINMVKRLAEAYSDIAF